MDYAFISRDGSVEDIESLSRSPLLAWDVESTGTHSYKDTPLGFSVCNCASAAYWADIQNMYFRQIMSNPNRLYIGHNVSYDRTKMKQVGVNIDNVCDTMVAAHLCESEHLGLDYLLRGNTGHYLIKYSDLKRPLIDMSPQELCEYAGPHARAAWILWHGYEDDKYDWPGYKTELKRNLTWNVFWNLEMPLVPVLSDMEYNGVAVDANYLTELGAYFDEKIALLEEALKYWSGHTDVNFNSPDQVAKVFYDELEIKPPWRKTGSGRPAVEGKYLETIKNAHPIIPYYLRYKQLQKLKGTYVTGLLGQIVNGRVYGNFNQTGTRTSRLSSSNPNLQNIPIRAEEGRKIRRAFVAPEGYTLVKSDADQLELKMIAHLSKDPYMLQAFREGRDIHLETALRAFGDANKRSEAKTMNYQISYGGGEPEQQEAFFSAYPVVKKWTQKVHQEVQELGYVRTLFGRKRSLPEALSTYPKDREHGCREAVSTIVQGSSAEVIKIGMRRIWEDIKDTDVKTVLQVHDELVFQVPDNTVEDFMPCLKEKMQYDELEVPITHTISYGKTWADMKKWNGNNKE